MPATGDSPHELLLVHLDFIRSKVEQLCRRHRASSETAEEMFGDLKVKLLDNDCEVLRRFRGDAKLTTYLSVVIDRFFYDWTARQWGSWRSASTGPEVSAGAQEVEQLVGRDGFSREEALRIVASRRGTTSASELRRLDDGVPQSAPRPRPRLVGLEAAQDLAAVSSPSPEEALCAGEAQRQLDTQLAQALAALGSQDRLLVRLRFGNGLTVAAIARTLGLRQRELYSRIEKALKSLREHLQADGLGSRVVKEHLARLERLPDPPLEPSRQVEPKVARTVRRPERQALRGTPREVEPATAPVAPADARRSAT
jgi:RNA polymerase sigma factor (sigma-70 family)